MASATGGGTSWSMGKPAFTRARICDDETASGKPSSVRPRNGAGKFAGAPPGRGMTTNSRQLRQFAGFAPFIELGRVVRADQIKQFRLRKSSRVIAHGVDGVGNAAAPDFLLVNFAIRFARQRQPEQVQPDGGRRGLVVRLERRLRRRNEKQPVQAQFLARRLRDQQMAEVDRVKRTAK